MKYIKIFFQVLLLLIIVGIPIKTADLVVEKEEKKDDVVVGNLEIKDPQEELVVQEKKDEVITKNNPSVSTGVGWWTYPEDIKTATRSGDDLLVLVNKEYKLPSTYAPEDLVSASNSGIRRGSSYYLRNILISDLSSMITASKADGIDLSIVSGYRSFATQQSTYQSWLNKNNGNVAYVDTFSARAGHSQHQLGTVIDFSSSEIKDALGDSFSNTNASKWLKSNAYKYGFVISYPSGFETTTGYKYESWHYRYIGIRNATEMINSGNILEIYLRSKN